MNTPDEVARHLEMKGTVDVTLVRAILQMDAEGGLDAHIKRAHEEALEGKNDDIARIATEDKVPQELVEQSMLRELADIGRQEASKQYQRSLMIAQKAAEVLIGLEALMRQITEKPQVERLSRLRWVNVLRFLMREEGQLLMPLSELSYREQLQAIRQIGEECSNEAFQEWRTEEYDNDQFRDAVVGKMRDDFLDRLRESIPGTRAPGSEDTSADPK